MENTTTWLELQQNQTQIPFSSFQQQPQSSAYPPSSTHYLSYPQNPNPPPLEPPLNPPGVDSYTPLNPITHLPPQTLPDLTYAQNPLVVDSNSNSLVASSGYYLDPNAQNWAAREAVRQYGADPSVYAPAIAMPSNGSEQLAVANPNTTWWTNTEQLAVANPSTGQPQANGTWKKHQKKAKTRIVQSAYCEVCKIDCTSKEVLDQHKLGKKHKKNLDKLRESLNPTQVQASGSSSNPVIGPQLPIDKRKSSNKSKRKTAETPEELEKKKKKVLEGGAAAEAVRICGICNVVCNSETVYNFHLAGQKHAAMLKKASHLTQSNAT
ncbi:hypothetical protein RJT34_18343 [Clitoria ternatea]|uniref:U1-type domain-containing protein n=1 Tax=Clitoria ternatea TaxID=43366 RepID=A0AAN9JDS7_CLITE